MSVPTSIGLRTMVTGIVAALEATGLKKSPSLMSVSGMPKNVVDLAFALDLTSKDTNKYRNGLDSILRAEHILTITVAKLVKPLDQYASFLDALEIEERVMKAVSAADVLTTARVDWVETRRPLTATREHILVTVVIIIEHDWTWDS